MQIINFIHRKKTIDSNIKKITNNTHTQKKEKISQHYSVYMPTAVDHITATGKPCTINSPAY